MQHIWIFWCYVQCLASELLCQGQVVSHCVFQTNVERGKMEATHQFRSCEVGCHSLNKKKQPVQSNLPRITELFFAAKQRLKETRTETKLPFANTNNTKLTKKHLKHARNYDLKETQLQIANTLNIQRDLNHGPKRISRNHFFIYSNILP